MSNGMQKRPSGGCTLFVSHHLRLQRDIYCLSFQILSLDTSSLFTHLTLPPLTREAVLLTFNVYTVNPYIRRVNTFSAQSTY